MFKIFGKWVIVNAKLPHGLTKNEPLRIRISAIPPYYAGLNDVITIWTAKKQTEAEKPEYIENLQAAAVLNVKGGPAERFMIYSHPTPGIDNKVRTVLAPEDRYGNLTEFDKKIPLKLRWNGKEWTENIKASKIIELDSPNEIGRLQASVLMKDLSYKDNISNAKQQGNKLVVTGNPVWLESPNGQKAGFGEFHWHTEISGDGGGTVTGALLV